MQLVAQCAAIVVTIGVTISFGARAVASTVELAAPPAMIEVPESAQLFGAGLVLVGAAASARLLVNRRSTRHD